MAKDFIKTRWPLLAILAVFIILKYPHLFYPYYWDESWPYASAVYKMYLHGPSLLPGSIDGEMSRGHPLMFHFLGAIWLKVFGTSRVAMHSFPLFISVCLLVAVYESAIRLFNIRAAVTAVLLIAFQQMFFVQSAFVLLEMMLAFLAFISLYFYVTKKYLLSALTLTMLFLTKESGMVLGLVLGIDALIRLFNKNIALKEKILNCLALAIPVACTGLFFIIQKKVSGWYVLPMYSQGIEKDWNTFYEKMRAATRVVFYADCRWYLFAAFLLIVAYVTAMQKRLQYALPLLAGFWMFLLLNQKVQELVHSPGSVVAYVLICLYPVVALFTVYKMIVVTGYTSGMQKRFMLLATIFALAFFAFTSVNLFIDRYLLIAFVPALFIGAVYYSFYVHRVSRYAFIPSLLLIVAIQLYAFRTSYGLGDNQVGAFKGMYVHEQIVQYLEKNRHYNKTVSTGAYLQRIHLTDPYTGYLSGKDTFNVIWDINGQTDFIIFDNIEPDSRYEQVKTDSNYTRIFRTEKGEAWGEIYAPVKR